MLPVGIGIIIGGGFLTKNPYLWYMLIGYLITMIIIRFIISRLISFKENVDKKIAIKNAGVEGINSAIEYIDFTFVHLWGGFDRFYPVYVFFFGITAFVFTFIFLYYHLWLYALGTFILFNLFTILNQIWRKVKNYDKI